MTTTATGEKYDDEFMALILVIERCEICINYTRMNMSVIRGCSNLNFFYKSWCLFRYWYNVKLLEKAVCKMNKRLNELQSLTNIEFINNI